MANVKDGATGTVLTAPSPATTGVTLTLQTGEGARFPTAPFYVIAHPNNTIPTVSISEKLLVSDITGDTLTFVRAQGIYTAKSIAIGWRISNAIFQEDMNNASIIQNEAPGGLVNGSNVTYTLASSVHQTGTLKVYKNGVRMKNGGADFTETATGFTMVTAPLTGTVLLVDYIVAGAINNVGTNSTISDEVPVGLVNSSNAIYTCARAYIPGSLEVFINGIKQARTTHFTETTPASGVFTMGDAPLTGDNIIVNYQFNLNPSGNCDTIDGIHANSTPTANNILPLNSSGVFPTTVTPSTPVAVNRQHNTTDIVVSNQLIQTGWGFVLGTGTLAYASKVVTYPITFDAPPIIIVTFLACKVGSDPTAITDFVTGADYMAKVDLNSASQFTATVESTSANVIANTRRCGFSWVAIGTKAR